MKTELIEMAEMLQAKDVDGEYSELVENALLTAEMNPVSETAVDLKFELMEALQEVR